MCAEQLQAAKELPVSPGSHAGAGAGTLGSAHALLCLVFSRQKLCSFNAPGVREASVFLHFTSEGDGKLWNLTAKT